MAILKLKNRNQIQFLRLMSDSYMQRDLELMPPNDRYDLLELKRNIDDLWKEEVANIRK